MDFFLPVAQVQIDIGLIIFLSFCVGLISGLFGIGGGFLMSPVLILTCTPINFHKWSVGFRRSKQERPVLH